MVEKSSLTRTIYMFGSITNGPYGYMTFDPKGRVTTRYHEAEAYYALSEDGILSLKSSAGIVTSTMRPGLVGDFLPHSGYPHYLFPAFSLKDPPKPSSLPPVFVNTTPKAGTYLFASALSNAGYRSLQLHCMDDFFHDNRDVDEDIIHWNPQIRQVSIPSHAVASIMAPGEFVVGHLNDIDRMYAVQRSGATLINIVRDPISQLISMFYFKIQKVMPSPEDCLWQSMSGVDAFKGFLLSSPVSRWISQTEVILNNFPYSRYEDIIAGKFHSRALGFKLSRNVQAGLKSAIGTKTSTYIQRDRGGDNLLLADSKVRSYLDEIGATELSRRYWS